MTSASLSSLVHRAKALGSSILVLSLAGSSFLLTSCTTEEGVVAGALAGAAIGGIVGHSSEQNYKRSRGHYRNNNYGYGYDSGYDQRYYEPRRAYPRYSNSNYRNNYISDPYCY